jgi:ubiquinone/menaquinone biosynthesis C-methylase UbiE
MTGFDTIAATLRNEILAFYADQRAESARLTQATLETNSGYVERRSRPMVELFEKRAARSVAGAEVLDVGCGFGAMAVFFAANGASVTAIDPNSARLAVGRAVAQAHDLALNFRVGRAEELDQPSSRFDLVLMNNSLCYVVEQDARMAALREALRVLRPGGWLLTRNPNRSHPIDQYTGLPVVPLLPAAPATAVAARLGRKRSLVTLRTPWAARKELQEAGFEEVRQDPPGPGRMRAWLKWLARYQHVSGRRPLSPGTPSL